MSHRTPNEAAPGAEVTIPITKTTIALGAIAAILLVVHLITRLVLWSAISVPAPVGVFLDRFNVDQEITIPTLFSALVLFSIAVAAFVIARTGRPVGPPSYRWWYGVAGIFVVLSIDEAAALHEIAFGPVQRTLGITSGPFLFAWVIPAGVAVIIVAGIFLKFFLSLPRDIQVASGIGALVYLAGALGMQMLKAALIYEIALPNTGGSLTVDVLSGVEEAFEMAGAILVLRALLLYLERYALAERSVLVRLEP